MVQQEVGVNKPAIGIIYPPPELRNIVDKTASFVARNGPDFETRIKENEKANTKFNFLNPGDPYNAYYRFKINEFQESQKQQQQAAVSKGDATKTALTASNQAFVKKLIPQKKVTSIYDSVNVDVPIEAPPDYEFVADPPSISAQDLDIVKLTAQFVARNGRQFLSSLMHREARNFQFDFLRPQHSLFNYFTKLVEQYTKILLPPKDIVERLGKESVDIKMLVSEIKRRELWIKQCKEEKQAADDLAEKEKLAYAQIDWHDFVVVETVDFTPGEFGNFPPPTTPENVGMRALMREREEEEARRKAIGATMLSASKDGKDNKDDSKKAGHFKDGESSGDAGRKGPTDLAQKIMDEEMGTQEGKEGGKSSDNVSSNLKQGGNVGQKLIDSTRVPLVHPSGAQPPPLTTSQQLAPPPPPPPLASSTTADSSAQPAGSISREPQISAATPQQTMIVTSSGGSENIIIKRDYDPKAKKQMQAATPGGVQYLVSPITGEKIPAHKMQEHLRYGLLDPQWLEQRERSLKEKREQEEVYASGVSIGSSLKKLAERRTDIFGAGHKETYIGRKINEDADAMWDGQTLSKEPIPNPTAPKSFIPSSSTSTFLNAAEIAKNAENEEQQQRGDSSFKTSETAGQNFNQQELNVSTPKLTPLAPPTTISGIAQLLAQQKKAAAPITTPQVPIIPAHPMMMPPLGMMGGPPMPGMVPFLPPGVPPPPSMLAGGLVQQPVHHSYGVGVEASAAKRLKVGALDEATLIPENEFLAHNPNPVRVNIKVPMISDKPELKCEGQTLTFTLPLTDNVSVIKAKIYEALAMPAGKQKLQYQGLFIKDSNTLAYYNFGQDSMIELSLKERGGRKK